MSELLKKVLTGEKECGKVREHVSETCDNQEEIQQIGRHGQDLYVRRM